MCSVGLREMRRRLTQERNAGRQDAGATPASSRLLLHPARSVFLRVTDEGGLRISTLKSCMIYTLRSFGPQATRPSLLRRAGRMTRFFYFEHEQECAPLKRRLLKNAHPQECIRTKMAAVKSAHFRNAS